MQPSQRADKAFLGVMTNTSTSRQTKTQQRIEIFSDAISNLGSRYDSGGDNLFAIDSFNLNGMKRKSDLVTSSSMPPEVV